MVGPLKQEHDAMAAKQVQLVRQLEEEDLLSLMVVTTFAIEVPL